jgi:hypothetical protein
LVFSANHPQASHRFDSAPHRLSEQELSLRQNRLYFVIDTAAPLLLYTGESCQSDQRWKGTHDAKRYIDKYIDLHRQCGLSPAVSISFWYDAPVSRRARQQLELALNTQVAIAIQ